MSTSRCSRMSYRAPQSRARVASSVNRRLCIHVEEISHDSRPDSDSHCHVDATIIRDGLAAVAE
eukprot:8523213-Pyramimonas_sp.AAC.1